MIWELYWRNDRKLDMTARGNMPFAECKTIIKSYRIIYFKVINRKKADS